MNLKKLVLILLISSLIVGACKKSKPVTPTPAPLSYNDITRATIVANEQKLKEDYIYYNNTTGTNFKVGSVIFYKTHSGMYGKLQIVSVMQNFQTSLTINFITYKANGEILTEKTNLTLIDFNRGINLDTGALVNDSTIDFQWTHLPDGFSITPWNGPLFYLYSK
jgi:hypothetical protein